MDGIAYSICLLTHTEQKQANSRQQLITQMDTRSY